MQNFDQIFLQPVAAAVVTSSGTVLSSFNCQVSHVSAGNWQVLLNEQLPFGQYVAVATPITGATTVVPAIIDGDAVHKFLSTLVNGVQGDVGCCVTFFALPSS